MYSLLLKKAIPFALTFIIGSFIGGLFKSFVPGAQRAEPARSYFYGYGEGRSCPMHARQRYLVAESKPLRIIFKPDARWPQGVMMRGGTPFSARLNVTFGADGKVAEVTPLDSWLESAATERNVLTSVWLAVESAARQIRFEPRMENGMPTADTQEVEIRFMTE